MEENEESEAKEKHHVKTDEKSKKSQRRVQKSLTCPQCGKSFSHKQIQVHMKIHTGEGPNTCDQCGKGFTQKTGLKEHMKIHTGEKPYTCDQCGKSFSKANTFKLHLRYHSGKRPYNCDQCGKDFF